MERASLVVQGPPALAQSLLPGAQRPEILGGFGDDVVEQLDDDPTRALLSQSQVQIHENPAWSPILHGGVHFQRAKPVRFPYIMLRYVRCGWL